MLEGWVAAGEEASQVAVDTALGLVPVFDEDGVIADCIALAGH